MANEEEKEERTFTSLDDLRDELEEHQGKDDDSVGEVDIVAENDAKAVEKAAEGDEKPAEDPKEELAADSESGDEEITETAAEEPAEAYKADLTYKVNGEEKEFDPRIHALLDNKENEDYFREIYQKSEAFDLTKEKLGQYRDEFNSLADVVDSVIIPRDSGDYKQMFKNLNLDKMSLADALEGLGYNKQSIIQHAYDLATLTEDQEVQYNGNRQLEQRNRQLENQQAYDSQRFEELQSQSKQLELQSELSKPGIKEIVDAFDVKNGAGAFWDEVCYRGIAHFNNTGKDKATSEVAKEIIDRYGLSIEQTNNTAVVNNSVTSPETAQANQEALAVIPNVGTSNKGPTKRKITSLADIEKEYNELYG